jgi:hypothetical protein
MAVLGMVGCSRGPVVTVANHSGVTLSNVVVSGRGFSEQISALTPAEERQIVVHPRGESDIRLTFEASGRKIDSGGANYFENSSNYRISLTVGTNLDIVSSSRLKQY